MKNPYELLQQKEADLARVRNQVESLRLVAALLSEDLGSDEPIQAHISAEKPLDAISIAKVTDTMLSSSPATRRSFHRFRSATDFLESLHPR
jgi:hypothetical protein